MSVPGFAIALDAIVPDPDPAMFTVGDTWADAGFVTTNPNVYVVPAATVNPLCTVSVNVPELHAPLDCVVPSENSVSPSSPASNSVTGLVATALLSPEIVTTELSAAFKSMSVTSVTVMVLDNPSAGVLCPIAFVVKVGSTTRSGSAPFVTP